VQKLTAEVIKLVKPAAKQEKPDELINALLDFYAQANDSAHPIRNILLRVPLDSPELLAVIQREGAV
jgi:hypothetical protein